MTERTLQPPAPKEIKPGIIDEGGLPVRVRQIFNRFQLSIQPATLLHNKRSDKYANQVRNNNSLFSSIEAVLLQLCCCSGVAAAVLLQLCCCSCVAAAVLLQLCCCNSCMRRDTPLGLKCRV